MRDDTKTERKRATKIEFSAGCTTINCFISKCYHTHIVGRQMWSIGDTNK